MDKQQYDTVVRWAERGAEAEKQISGREHGPFANVAEGLKGFGSEPTTQAQRDEYLDRTMVASAAMAERMALMAQLGIGGGDARADMLAYSGIVLALELAAKVADAGLNIEIAG